MWNIEQNGIPSSVVASWVDSADDSSAEPDSVVELAEVSTLGDAVDRASSGVPFTDSSSAVWSCDHNSMNIKGAQSWYFGLFWPCIKSTLNGRKITYDILKNKP